MSSLRKFVVSEVSDTKPKPPKLLRLVGTVPLAKTKINFSGRMRHLPVDRVAPPLHPLEELPRP
jgi:hypothetical protein